MSNTGNVRLTSETRHFAEITINGQSKGKREINGTPTLKDFAKSLAKEFGLTSFNVQVDFGDGLSPVTSEAQASRPATQASSVAVSAKDSRAADTEPVKTEETPAPVEGDTGDEQPKAA
jgi:hypothetical protein